MTIGEAIAANLEGVTGASLSASKVQVATGDAVTATTGGGTTGLIPAGSSFVTVTSDSADKQISLPAASVGHVIRIKVGATGCELISAVAADKINNVVVGATNELALAANCLYVCEYVVADNWRVHGFDIVGGPLGPTTAALTTITHQAPGTPDYAIAALTQTTPWGFVAADEGHTVLSAIANLQLRVLQLETAAKLTPDAL